MVRQSAKIIFLELIGLIIFLSITAAIVLGVMLVNGPVELGVFRDDVEQALADARDGRPVSIERLTLQWSPTDQQLYVVASDVTLKDENEQAAGFAETANLTLDSSQIFQGKIEVLSANLVGGWMNAKNTGPNLWTLAGDPLPEIKAAALPTTPEEWLERANSVLGTLLSIAENSEETVSLEQAVFSDMQINVIGLKDDVLATVSDVSAAIDRSNGDLVFDVAGNGESLGLPGSFGFGVATSGGYGAVRSELFVEQWPIVDFLQRLGVDRFEGGDLSADIKIVAGATKTDGVERVSIDIQRQSGVFHFPGSDIDITDAALQMSYLVSDDAIEVDVLDIETGPLAGRFAGRLDNVLAQNQLRALSLTSPAFVLDLSPTLPQPYTVENVELGLRISDDFKVIDIDRFVGSTEGLRIQSTGELDFTVDHKKGELPISLDLSTELIGDAGTDTILKFWPKTLGVSAREFVQDRILKGSVSEMNAQLTLRPDSFAQGFLQDDHLSVGFAFQDVDVRFMDDVPPVTNSYGVARMTGNSLSIDVIEGDYVDWKVETAGVSFPKFNPKGEDFFVRGRGHGPAVTAMRVASESQLQIEAQTGFDPDRIFGDARGTFFLSRPSVGDFDPEETVLKVDGTVTNGGLRSAALEMDLIKSRINVDLDLDRLILTGSGEIGTSPVQFTWRDSFEEDNTPALLSATGVVTPDVLNEFGIVGRAYLTGEIPVEMQGIVDTEGLDDSTFNFDLTDARVDVGEIGWVKPAGESARVNIRYSGDLQTQASVVRLQSKTAELDGDILLKIDGRLESLTLRKFKIQNSADLKGIVSRNAADILTLDLSGAFLDVSPLIGQIGAVGGAGESATLPVIVKADVEELKLRQGLSLRQAQLNFESDSIGVKSVSAEGKTVAGAALKGSYAVQTDGSGPKVRLETGDAGFLLDAFFGADFLRGGELDLNGQLGIGDQPSKFRVKIRDGQFKDAPFFTQILSLASLRGLADTLSGDGVLFSEIDFPITIGGGRIVLDGARASGPALGITANGFVETNGEGIELDGVLVPSFGVNSLLGGVPIIGDLVVGREGEGIFSITYSVSGTLEKAQVAVNPLSAVTPGILRRIFENPSDVSIPKGIPIDPGRLPPTAKLPELPEDEYIAPTPGSGG